MDARVVRTRANVLRAATDLLVEGGPTAVTIDAIVARSGVARSTIYRHWDTRDDVLLAVIESCAPRIDPPAPALDFEASLRELTEALRRQLNDPEWARVLPALLTLRNQDHGVADLEQRLEARQEDVMETVLRRGVAEGRIPADVDVEEATAILVGPLLFASIVDRRPVAESLAERAVTGFLRAYGAEVTARS